MAIFKLKPSCKDYLWGGTRLRTEFGIEYDRDPLAESWELSCHPDGPSYIVNGEYAGKTLQQYIDENGKEILGTDCQSFEQFPILIKFIDAKDDLSIQVHPDDEYAMKNEGQYGKTEMWYVVAADRGAHLKSGFSEQLTPAEYERKVADHTLTDALCDYSVAAGDLFFLPAGRVHAICAGTFVAEIQQTSDVTYRIYDYGRTGADGKPRELHTELAKDAIDYTVLPDYRSHYVAAKNREVPLVSCPYFVTSLYDLDRAFVRDLSELDSFLIVMCLEGSGALCDDEGNEMPIRQGETLLVPASARLLRLLPDEHLKLLTGHL